jgi:hypothetical protein
MEFLYVECHSGVSGDMTVAALLDLGADRNTLLEGLKSLKIDGYKIEISRVLKNGFNACDFNVILDDKQDINERNIHDIYRIIDSSSISDNAKNISKKVFKIKAEAEAKAHGISIEEVYFHEKGAIDSIIDIVSASICLDNLEIGDVIVSELYDGSGYIKCRRGIIPVPVPAVTNIVSAYDMELIQTDIEGEMVTPTGASIMAGIRTKNSLPENCTVKKIGFGAGKRNYPNDGVLRMFLM